MCPDQATDGDGRSLLGGRAVSKKSEKARQTNKQCDAMLAIFLLCLPYEAFSALLTLQEPKSQPELVKTHLGQGAVSETLPG